MALQDTLETLQNLDINDINDINWDRVGVWPLAARAVLFVTAIAVILAATYFIRVKELNILLQSVTQEEQTLRKTFEEKAFQSATLDQYRQQMKEMKKTFKDLLGQLPNKTEVPGLLEDIDDKGVASGLEIESIKLQPKKKGEFYVELPIEIIVTGSFHDFGAFVSDLAAMARIVTLHDLSIINVDDSKSKLTMIVQAKTYSYSQLENEEG
jgi:type IV pilus assembly protein PilO